MSLLLDTWVLKRHCSADRWVFNWKISHTITVCSIHARLSKGKLSEYTEVLGNCCWANYYPYCISNHQLFPSFILNSFIDISKSLSLFCDKFEAMDEPGGNLNFIIIHCGNLTFVIIPCSYNKVVINLFTFSFWKALKNHNYVSFVKTSTCKLHHQLRAEKG